MSADDYIECPICHGLHEKLRGGYKQFYGKVTEEEYNTLKEQYEHRDTRSVAVYREISIYEGESITLDMDAECGNCSAKWKHHGVVK